MTLFRTPGFLRALRSLVLSVRRDRPRVARVITVPAPLNRPDAEAVVIQMPRPADLSAARAAAAARVTVGRRPLQTHRNIALLSRQA
ncbi:hypothetical protein HDE76_002577 [Rhodanobacter sp. ANJX3]|uniref:hypothetical protein n=1 Tax=Rhodanobacter sp. ANJX3 TaxID=2723083 RepID=UPI001616F4F0|nr:hypothetical protein [Rhodanobacter sp. ANJX3]MBB5359348.1 hypothetical protein [Rhodanobacter sp. ANJX3]